MADQKLPHFIPRIQMGNRSPRYNSLQGWSCPFKRSVSPVPVVPLEMWATAGCGSTTGMLGTRSWRHGSGRRAHVATAALAAGRASSSHSSEMAGRKQTSGCLRGNGPWAAAVHNSSSCFPFFSFHEGGRKDGDHLAQFPLRCKSGLKATKGRV